LAKRIPLTNLSDELEARIYRRLRANEPNSPKMREALLRIGFMVENQAKLNVRRQGVIDTGRLFNSIRSIFYQRGDHVGISVGAFGVPYASMHEFGGIYTARQRRAMFASLRERGKIGKGGSGINKGVLVGDRLIARPYLRPAVLTQRNRILDIIRDLYR